MLSVAILVALILLVIVVLCAVFALSRFRASAGTMDKASNEVLSRLQNVEARLSLFDETLEKNLAGMRREQSDAAEAGRAEQTKNFAALGEVQATRVMELGSQQRESFQNFASQLSAQGEMQANRMKEISESQANSLSTFSRQLTDISRLNEEKLEAMRATVEGKLQESFQNFASQLSAQGDAQANRMKEISESQSNSLSTFSRQLTDISRLNEEKLEAMRKTVEGKLQEMQKGNEEKLEAMRKTVDEQLHATLEKRLGEAFTTVSERLEQVHKGLGEMRALTADVGDLKKVLSNVKTRGTWGEMQLEALLEQMLAKEQYAKNVRTRPKSKEQVEFAIILPGRGDDGSSVYLPIDSKFPLEDYKRIIEASESGDVQAIAEAQKALKARVLEEAKSIHSKYIEPPYTTDFGILYLPVEGLYAEVLRIDGLSESISRDYRVIPAGPTTICALLNSLQMGFRTLAIEKRSSEVWELLGKVKTEFEKFGTVLDKTREKIEAAGKELEKAGTRTNVINRVLRNVQQLPIEEGDVFGIGD